MFLFLYDIPFSIFKAPTDPPSNLRNTGIAPSSMSFSWDDVPCGSRGGEITGYVYDLSSASNGDLVLSGTTSAANRFVMLSGLGQQMPYDFRVAAVTSVGTGPYVSMAASTTGKRLLY